MTDFKDVDEGCTLPQAIAETQSCLHCKVPQSKNGCPVTRENPYGMATRTGVFAGGDVTNNRATVVHAMQDTKQVADGIARYIDAVKLLNHINGN